jgi:nucleotide-binding universal stress UspA family protein
MSAVLACLDRSAYAASVCDHAAWLAGPLGAPVDVLRVAEGEGGDGKAADELLQMARERLEQHGVEAARIVRSGGDFATAVEGAAEGARVVVLGKRGERSDRRRGALGSHAEAMLRDTERLLCLVSQVYLPISRALVITDSDPDHRRVIETIAGWSPLSDLDLEVILMGSDDDPGAAGKLAWARETLKAAEADIFCLDVNTPDEACARYMDDHKADVIVMSREMLLDPSRTGHGGDGLQSRPLWRWRTPLVIC